MSERKPLFVHVHIPKTGGQSLNAMLHRTFGKGFIQLYGSMQHRMFSDLEMKALATILSDRECIASHHIVAPFPTPEIPIVFVPFTFVREPVDRAISEFLYMKGRIARGVVKSIPADSFPEWLAAANQSSLELSGGEYSSQREMQSYYLGIREGQVIAPAALDPFLEVGVIDRFEESLIILRRKLAAYGVELQITTEVRNKTPRTSGSAQRLREKHGAMILEANPRDAALYRAAVERLDREIANYDGDFAGDLAALQSRPRRSLSARALIAARESRLYQRVTRSLTSGPSES